MADATATTWTIVVENWLPVTLNELLRLHHAERSRVLRREARLVAGYALVAGVPKATGRRRVTLRLTRGPRDRMRDVDGSFKSPLDALVKAGLLIDDSPAWCDLAPLEQARGAARMTEILLQDLEDTP